MTIQVKLCSNCSVVSLEISIKPHHARPKRTIQCNHPSSWYSRNPCCSSILQFTTSWVPLLELLACDGLPRSQATPKLLQLFENDHNGSKHYPMDQSFIGHHDRETSVSCNAAHQTQAQFGRCVPKVRMSGMLFVAHDSRTLQVPMAVCYQPSRASSRC